MERSVQEEAVTGGKSIFEGRVSYGVGRSIGQAEETIRNMGRGLIRIVRIKKLGARQR